MINFLLILLLITSTFITIVIASVIVAKIFEAIRDEIYDIKFRKMLEKAEEIKRINEEEETDDELRTDENCG